MADRKRDISGSTFEELPETCGNHVPALEKMVGCPIKYISAGAERDAYIERSFRFKKTLFTGLLSCFADSFLKDVVKTTSLVLDNGKDMWYNRV